MEDVDEGIISSESNQSNKSSSDIKDELKCLNNSTMIGKDCNGFSQNLNGKLNSNGLLKYSDNIPETTKEQNDTGDNIPETSKEPNDEVENESDSLSDLNDNSTEVSVNDNEAVKQVIDNEAVKQVNDNEAEMQVNDNDTEMQVNANDLEEQVNKGKFDDQNAEVLESIADPIDENDGVKDNIETTNHVKHDNSASDNDKSSFHIPLDEKLRNSLKGLVAKVKSSEVLKDSGNPDTSNSSDKDETKSGITPKDELESDKDNVNITNPDDQKTKESYDALLLDSDNDNEDDGISMDLGSDCEDYENALLDSGSENLDEKSCNITSGISESNETKSKCESKLDCKIEPECFKASSGENTIDIKQIKNDAGVKVEKNDQSTESINENLVKSEKSSDIDENPDIKIDISSDNDTTSEEINDLSELQSHNTIEETNESSALKSSESKVYVEEDPMLEGIDKSEETQSEDVEPAKLKSIIGDITEKVDSDKMLGTSKGEVVEEESPMETLVESKGIDVKVSAMETLGGDKVVEVEEESAMEEDNDVIFQKITKINNINVSQTNDPNHKPDKVLADTKGVNGNNISSGEDNDVIFEKVTNAEGVKLEKSCDKVETDKVCTAANVNYKLLNGSKHDTNVIEAGDDLVSSSSDRKRAADDSELCENDTKRKKLSVANGIGKHESQEEPTSIELLDSDDEDIIVENGEVPCTDKKVSEPTPKDQTKVITVTEEELDSLVREKVKAYLASQQNTLIAKLTQKVKELQTNNDLWKRQVKDLQVKVNEVTVLQQKLEKRKAATNALRQIRTRHVAIQVDNGKTSSSKSTKQTSTPPRAPVTSVPMVTSPAGTGTIRLPIPQSSYGTSTMPTQMAPGTKLIPTSYKTPSVKSLLDTTKVQKTVGSVSPTATTGANSVIGLVQYPPNFMSKTMVSQGFATLPQGMVTQVATIGSNVPKTATKALTLTSPTAKVIDLTEDDDSKNQTRFLALQTGMNPGMRTMLPPGTQLVRSGTQQPPTYQVVFSPPSAGIRPGTVSVASSLSQTPILTGMQPVPIPISQQQQNITPGTTMARAAVPAIPSVVVQQQQHSVVKHPAPFPVSSTKQQNAPGFKAFPPKPSLSISRVSQGIVLSWNMSLNDTYAKVNNYQLFAYQETSSPPVSTLWKKVGDVKALPLPMACTLTQFQVGNKYHFAVRALDEHSREGSFSDPGSIHLTAATSQSSK